MHVLANLLNALKVKVLTRVVSLKVFLYVKYGGQTIFKSTLVSQLNGPNPFLSKDHLTRVKHILCFNNHSDYIIVASLIYKLLVFLD